MEAAVCLRQEQDEKDKIIDAMDSGQYFAFAKLEIEKKSGSNP